MLPAGLRQAANVGRLMLGGLQVGRMANMEFNGDFTDMQPACSLEAICRVLECQPGDILEFQGDVLPCSKPDTLAGERSHNAPDDA